MVEAKQKLTIGQAAAGEPVSNFLRATSFLAAVYQRMKECNSSYSYRQFSEDLGFGHTNYMHLIVTAYRPLTLKAGKRIAEALGLTGTDRKYFETLVSHDVAKNAEEKEQLLARLVELKRKVLPPTPDRDMLEYLSAWYHPVVRELVALADFSEDPVWIVERIRPKITVEQAAASLELLLKIGYIVRDEESGKIFQREPNVKTGAVVRSLAVRQYHNEMLDLSRDALMSLPSSKRDFQALTIPVSEELVIEIKAEMERFWRWVLERSAAAEKPSEVCQLNMQFFSVTKTGEDKSK